MDFFDVIVVLIVLMIIGTIIAQNAWFFQILFVGLGVLAYKWFTAWSPAAKERERKGNGLSFDDGISEGRFQGIVAEASKRFRAADTITANSEGEVTIQWQSHSGKTFYQAVLDFNDHGHLTGEWWLLSSNEDQRSDLVQRVGDFLSAQIKNETTAVTKTA